LRVHVDVRGLIYVFDAVSPSAGPHLPQRRRRRRSS
jgi:hypothetical protein